MEGADRRQFSLIAGWAYLVIIACGLFAEFGVRQALFDPDAAPKAGASRRTISSSVSAFSPTW